MFEVTKDGDELIFVCGATLDKYLLIMPDASYLYSLGICIIPV